MLIAKNHGRELLDKLIVDVRDSDLSDDKKHRYAVALFHMMGSMEPLFKKDTPILRNLYRMVPHHDEEGTIRIHHIKRSLKDAIPSWDEGVGYAMD